MRALLLIALLAPAPAFAQTALVYLDSGGAPAQWERAAEEGIRAALNERGISLVPEPTPAPSIDAKIAAAKKDLDRGIAAYRELSLDAAVSALTAALNAARDVPESREAPAIAGDARVYLGVVALANGNAKGADDWFRKAAIGDPERRLSSKSFAPDIVAAYEKARKAVEAGPQVELEIDAPADAALFVDGRPAISPVKVPAGEHLVAAMSEAGTGGAIADAPSVQLRVVADGAKALAAARAAAKSRDDAALARALEALASATEAERVLTYDLRSKDGRVEAPMRLKEAGKKEFRFAVAELGSAPTSVERPIKGALNQLLNGSVASSRGGGGGGNTRPPATRKYGWAWWAGGAVAVLAAGAAGVALAQPPPGDDTVTIVVEK